MFFLPKRLRPGARYLMDCGDLRGSGRKSNPELTFDERLWVRRARHLQEILATHSPSEGLQIPIC